MRKLDMDSRPLKYDMKYPIKSEFEKAIWERRVPESECVPVGRKVIHKACASVGIRKERAKAYVEIICKCDLDLVELVRSERKADMAMRMLIRGESALLIAESYGVSRQTVYTEVYGTRSSVYTLLRRYVSRMVRE